MITRRHFNRTVPGLLGGGLVVSGCSLQPGAADYEALLAQTWRSDPPMNSEGMDLGRELIRIATLAPSSHNTQCWKFKLEDKAITLLPDLNRRCPAVDPDDHHVFVSLGCATENLAQAALAHGHHAEARLEDDQGAVRVLLTPTKAQATPLFHAIARRQCTRGEYDGKALSSEELALLLHAGTSSGVRMLLLTDRPAMDKVLDRIVQANTIQMADPAFVQELKTWIRFNAAEAVRTRDGLFSLTTGNPAIPTWLGQRAFGMFFKTAPENDKIARQIRSSGGIAVFSGQVADKAHWVEVGRCYERFALQATALGIRNALLNQPVEVPSARMPFAATLGLGDQRPDLVVRFGRGPVLPRSLRRPLQAVLV
jgi:hypothetical protein